MCACQLVKYMYVCGGGGGGEGEAVEYLPIWREWVYVNQ